MTEPLSDDTLAEIRADYESGSFGFGHSEIGVLLDEVDRLRGERGRLRDANLLLHDDIDRVRLEVGGARLARTEWSVAHPARAPFEFGANELRARECLANEIAIWGPDGWRLRSRITFVCPWRDEDGEAP